MVGGLKKCFIDDMLWKNHLIRIPYSTHLKTGKRQEFLPDCEWTKTEGEWFNYVMGLWDGSILDKERVYNKPNSLTTYEYALNFKRFIQIALEYGEQIRRMLKSEPYFIRPLFKKEIRPCLKTLPVNPKHHEHRLAFLWEHLNKRPELTDDDLVKMFSHVSDFNEKKVRYFINHAKRRKYKPYRCISLWSLGLCLGEQCEKFGRLVKKRIINDKLQ
jgi:hypothetical protein